MIDWKKEVATKNYCGYCTNTPTATPCDGTCFINSQENRIDHVLEMLKKIPEDIEILKKKEQDYKDSISIK